MHAPSPTTTTNDNNNDNNDNNSANTATNTAPSQEQLPTNIVPTNIAWLKFSGKSPMGLKIPPL